MPDLFRRAKDSDFDSIYEIWMQDHVLPFTSHEKMSKDDYKPIFNDIMASSEVYVIEAEGQIVATKRVVPGAGKHAHVVELGSFAVHQDHCGKGYGKRFYELLFKEIKTTRPEVVRIEIGQETDNTVAEGLAKKMGFEVEAILPDWIRRNTGSKKYVGKWNMGSRNMAYIYDPAIKIQSIKIEKYAPKIPALKIDIAHAKFEMDDKNGKAILYFDNKEIGIVHFHKGIKRYAHIDFWDIHLNQDCNIKEAEAAIRKLAVYKKEKEQCGKIEIAVSDYETDHLIQNLGFHCAGIKKASCKIGDQYFDEISADLGFFNIHDAIEFINGYCEDSYDNVKISLALLKCKAQIHALIDNTMDDYTALYLENMAYQMTREGLGEKAIHRYGEERLDPQPWKNLINQLPDNLKIIFTELGSVLKLTAKETSSPLLSKWDLPSSQPFYQHNSTGLKPSTFQLI